MLCSYKATLSCTAPDMLHGAAGLTSEAGDRSNPIFASGIHPTPNFTFAATLASCPQDGPQESLMRLRHSLGGQHIGVFDGQVCELPAAFQGTASLQVLLVLEAAALSS